MNPEEKEKWQKPEIEDLSVKESEGKIGNPSETPSDAVGPS